MILTLIHTMYMYMHASQWEYQSTQFSFCCKCQVDFIAEDYI